MKIALIVLLVIVAMALLFAMLIKTSARRVQKRNLKLLRFGYLGETYETFTKWLKDQPLDKHVSHYEDNDTKYVISKSESKKTLKIFQFSNNICTGFYIKSSERIYSLPYTAVYRTNFKKYSKSSLAEPFSEVDFGESLIAVYLRPFRASKKEFRKSSKSAFKEYYKVGKDRYLSIAIDVEQTEKIKHPTYLYLCANRFSQIEIFKKSLSDPDNPLFAIISAKSDISSSSNIITMDIITPLTNYSFYGFSDLNPIEKEFVNKIFELINKTLTNHCNYVKIMNDKSVSNDKLFLKKISLEIIAHYWLYLTQDFAKRGIDKNVGHVIITSFMEYYSDLKEEILKNGHEDFFDFISNRTANAVRIINDNCFDMGIIGYFEQIFLYEPLVKTHPYERRVSSFNLDTKVEFGAYYSKLNGEISNNSFDTIKEYF